MASQFGLSHGLPIRPLTASHGLSIWPLTWPLTRPFMRPLTQPRGAWPPTDSHTASQCGLPHSLSLSLREHGLPRPPNLASHGLPHCLARPCTASHLSGRPWEAKFGLSHTQPPTFCHVICLSQSGQRVRGRLCGRLCGRL